MCGKCDCQPEDVLAWGEAGRWLNQGVWSSTGSLVVSGRVEDAGGGVGALWSIIPPLLLSQCLRGQLRRGRGPSSVGGAGCEVWAAWKAGPAPFRAKSRPPGSGLGSANCGHSWMAETWMDRMFGRTRTPLRTCSSCSYSLLAQVFVPRYLDESSPRCHVVDHWRFLHYR